MIRTLAIDPGESTGLAYFEGRELRSCVNVSVPLGNLASTGSWGGFLGRYDRCVVERPRFYSAKSKVDANDLIVLALRAGILAQLVNAPRTDFVAPSEWKGQLPKNVCQNHIRAILSTDELALVAGQKHDVWDAVGIGLWAVGRFGR